VDFSWKSFYDVAHVIEGWPIGQAVDGSTPPSSRLAYLSDCYPPRAPALAKDKVRFSDRRCYMVLARQWDEAMT